jgi:hypothetical protein
MKIKGPDPNIKLLVDTEKSFQYSEELGWNWHKSWKLPAVTVQLDVKLIRVASNRLDY